MRRCPLYDVAIFRHGGFGPQLVFTEPLQPSLPWLNHRFQLLPAACNAQTRLGFPWLPVVYLQKTRCWAIAKRVRGLRMKRRPHRCLYACHVSGSFSAPSSYEVLLYFLWGRWFTISIDQGVGGGDGIFPYSDKDRTCRLLIDSGIVRFYVRAVTGCLPFRRFRSTHA